MSNLRFLLCLFVCASLSVACMSAASTTKTVGPSAVPTAVASPTISPTSTSSPTPADTIPTLGLEQRALDAGTYRLELNLIDVSGTKLPSILITVPDHWNSGGWLLNQPRSGQAVPPVAVQFWDVGTVYGQPCKWKGTESFPGPTVDDLAKALVAQPLRNATQPIDVTLDGYTGKYLEWSVPADSDFSTCDVDGADHSFQSWTGSVMGDNGPRFQQGPGQVDRLWILDIGGTRLVIDGFSMPSATSAERQALLDVVKSIKFER